MTIESSSWYAGYLRCPDCLGLLKIDTALNCLACEFQSTNARDLRPRKPRPCKIEFALEPEFDQEAILSQIDTSDPALEFRGPAAARDSRAFMSIIQDSVPNNGSVLDLGCGPGDQAIPLEWMGLRYVGIDHSSEQADLLADAHSLPFADASFDCVFSYAVLEHLMNPFVAITEVQRVLRPGGIYVGTVAQGEPFHASYFHHTSWGLISVLRHARQMRVVRLWAASDTLQSLANMGRYPRVLRPAFKLLDFVQTNATFLAPRRMRWSQKAKQVDALHRAGSIGFVCLKSKGIQNHFHTQEVEGQSVIAQKERP